MKPSRLLSKIEATSFIVQELSQLVYCLRVKPSHLLIVFIVCNNIEAKSLWLLIVFIVSGTLTTIDVYTRFARYQEKVKREVDAYEKLP